MASRFEAALVHYRTAWAEGHGFLVSDRRTIVVLGHFPRAGRKVTVRMAQSAGEEIEVNYVELRRRGHYRPPMVVLHAAAELSGTPLPLAQQPAALDDVAYLLLRPRQQHGGHDAARAPATEVAITRITGATDSQLAVGLVPPIFNAGTPVLDAAGHIVGFMDNSRVAVRAGNVFSTEQPSRRARNVAPMTGLKFGTEFGGLLNRPFTMDVDLGLVLWDQLGLTLRLGFSADRIENLGIPAEGIREAGMVEADQHAFNLGFEVEYRWLLRRSAMPLYLDLVTGLHYTVATTEPRGMALYSNTFNCQPALGDECLLVSGPTPDSESTQSVGFALGADLRLGGLTISYRYVPAQAAYNLPEDLHRLSFGFSMF
jgi:hypothetical protein